MPSTTTCPDAILTAIPWYPEGLTPDECGAVEAHAADCHACRAELAFLRGDEEPTIEIPDSEEVYARVLERIGGSEEPEGLEGGPAQLQWLRRFSQRAAAPVSIAVGLMVALVSGMLTSGVIWAVRVAPTYESVAGSPAVVHYGDHHLEVVFEEDATAGEIADQLRAVRASVVSGPTLNGAYRVRLAPGVDTRAAVEKLTRAEQGVVASAEPSRG